MQSKQKTQNISLCQKNLDEKNIYFTVKVPNSPELTKITINHTSEIDFKDFLHLYKWWYYFCIK